MGIPREHARNDEARGLLKLFTISFLSGVFVMLGCTAPRAGTPVTQDIKTDSVRGRIQYQRQITERRICSNDDAFHLLIQYVNQSDPCEAYPQRLQWLNERQMLPEQFAGQAEDAITRGTLAVGITKALQVRGGVMFAILPRSERYATRELVARGIYPAGSSPHQTYSGLEVIGILAKMEDSQVGDPANLPATEMRKADE
jgi:hypothetical protein